MSAFKKLTKSDIVVIPYNANKEWTFYSGSTSCILYEGQNLTGSIANSPTTSLGEYKSSIFASINHLFYQNYSSSLINTQSLASSLFYESASKYRPTGSYFIYNDNPALIESFPTGFNSTIQVMSFPKDVIGSKIKESTLVISAGSTITDDGRGNLYTEEFIHIGNIFYSHGLIIITNQDFQTVFNNVSYTASFKNEHVVYEQVIKCTVKEHEMNASYNPSLKKYKISPSSSIHDFATGSYFQPYATTVGLYNDKTELIAVAKLAKPMPISQFIDTNFIIKLDV